MKKLLKKFGGAIVLYLVIFGGIVALNSRLSYINNNLQEVVAKR